MINHESVTLITVHFYYNAEGNTDNVKRIGLATNKLLNLDLDDMNVNSGGPCWFPFLTFQCRHNQQSATAALAKVERVLRGFRGLVIN